MKAMPMSYLTITWSIQSGELFDMGNMALAKNSARLWSLETHIGISEVYSYLNFWLRNL